MNNIKCDVTHSCYKCGHVMKVQGPPIEINPFYLNISSVCEKCNYGHIIRLIVKVITAESINLLFDDL